MCFYDDEDEEQANPSDKEDGNGSSDGAMVTAGAAKSGKFIARLKYLASAMFHGAVASLERYHHLHGFSQASGCGQTPILQL